mmetsp:Transcript_27037/g.30197  ORF Transcript_27037/g.30197 Transcript_27037/m.30197 type:complete len:145 (+) Transcript_27037:824-1258(+)
MIDGFDASENWVFLLRQDGTRSFLKNDKRLEEIDSGEALVGFQKNAVNAKPAAKRRPRFPMLFVQSFAYVLLECIGFFMLISFVLSIIRGEDMYCLDEGAIGARLPKSIQRCGNDKSSGGEYAVTWPGIVSELECILEKFEKDL